MNATFFCLVKLPVRGVTRPPFLSSLYKIRGLARETTMHVTSNCDFIGRSVNFFHDIFIKSLGYIILYSIYMLHAVVVSIYLMHNGVFVILLMSSFLRMKQVFAAHFVYG